MKNLLLFPLILILLACSDDDDNQIDVPQVTGMSYVLSDRSFDETYNAIKTSLESNPNITIVAEVDHKSNASSVDLDLNNTKIIFFGNPALGTPLMMENQLTGIDLPQRMLVYEDDAENVFVGYNSTSYLNSRHGLDGQSTTLDQISNALATIASNAADAEVNDETSDSISQSEGISIVISNNSFDDTYDLLRGAIDNNENLTIVAELNHQENAASVNMSLRPTRVLIFGNPALGSPLMQDSQTTALDLPQKMLVYEDENGVVKVAYNLPVFLQSRHTISSEQNATLNTITGALQNLTTAAIEE